MPPPNIRRRVIGRAAYRSLRGSRGSVRARVPRSPHVGMIPPAPRGRCTRLSSRPSRSPLVSATARAGDVSRLTRGRYRTWQPLPPACPTIGAQIGGDPAGNGNEAGGLHGDGSGDKATGGVVLAPRARADGGAPPRCRGLRGGRRRGAADPGARRLDRRSHPVAARLVRDRGRRQALRVDLADGATVTKRKGGKHDGGRCTNRPASSSCSGWRWVPPRPASARPDALVGGVGGGTDTGGGADPGTGAAPRPAASG